MKVSFFLIIFCITGLALGQSEPAQTTTTESEPGAQTQVPPPTREELSALFAESGGSLLRVQASAALGVSEARSSASVEFIRASFFAVPPPQPRVLRKMDLVTVIIREQSEFKSEGTTDLQRDAKLSGIINEFVRLNLSNLQLEPNVGSVKPQLDLSGKREFNGEGTVDRKDSFTARVQARVVDVKPNGTLVLESRKVIKTDDEVQTYLLSGTVRAEDITADNSVLSTQMYDLRLEKNTEGAVRSATKRGWLTKLLDWMNIV